MKGKQKISRVGYWLLEASYPFQQNKLNWALYYETSWIYPEYVSPTQLDKS